MLDLILVVAIVEGLVILLLILVQIRKRNEDRKEYLWKYSRKVGNLELLLSLESGGKVPTALGEGTPLRVPGFLHPYAWIFRHKGVTYIQPATNGMFKYLLNHRLFLAENLPDVVEHSDDIGSFGDLFVRCFTAKKGEASAIVEVSDRVDAALMSPLGIPAFKRLGNGKHGITLSQGQTLIIAAREFLLASCYHLDKPDDRYSFAGWVYISVNTLKPRAD